MKRKYLFLSAAFRTFIFLAFSMTFVSFAQEEEKPISFGKKLEVIVSNSLDTERNSEPIIIPLASILEKAPDFNTEFYRLKHQSTWFEPLDIPSQIRTIPSIKDRGEELVFQVDLPPNGKKTVELWYNSEGADPANYPPKTQSFEKWYRMGTNIAWENEIIAYRSYNGVVDFFAKSYPHLRLNNLPPDSYHHERFWGLDPYMIGTKPGLCGVMLVVNGERIQCYGNPEKTGLKYIQKAIDGGSVNSGAVVQVENDDGILVEITYSLNTVRYENIVQAVLPDRYTGKDVLIAPGMQKFEGEQIIADEKSGYFLFQGSPVEEYGTIYTALIWNPVDADGFFETDEGRYVNLKPAQDGTVTYLSLALWSRGSAEPPTSRNTFIEFVQKLAIEFRNPVNIEITNGK